MTSLFGGRVGVSQKVTNGDGGEGGRPTLHSGINDTATITDMGGFYPIN